MWRLTDEAIRDGVKSTTRYRSKQPNKRGHRTQHPQPQRQASGAKGGQASRRSANLRRSKRQNEQYSGDSYISRSVPVAFDPSYNTEAPMQYPPSQYYGSEVDFGYPSKDGRNNFGGPLMPNGLGLFSHARPYAGSPISQGLSIGASAYVLGHSPSEPLFTNSPTPSTDEPQTPMSQGGWNEDLSLGAPCVFEEIVYPEYAG